jgi:drug/metabolite transporter (DMT)-like permease
MTIPARFRGIAAMLAATAAFVANDTCMKLAMSEAPPMQVLTMRGLAASLICMPLLLAFGLGRHLLKALNPWVLLRCTGEVFAIYCFIFGLQHMAIGDITAISQTTPLIVLLAGALFWGDRLGLGRLFLVGLGIAGAIIVAQPGSSTASPYAVLGFGTALGAAVRDIFSRKVDRAIPALIVTFATLVTVMLAGACGMALSETPVPPTGSAVALVTAAGTLLIGGHFFIFLAYRLAPPRVVAPFNYASTMWAVLSGFFVFDVVPNALAFSGMALILAAGLVVILLEGRTRSPAHNAQVISS